MRSLVLVCLLAVPTSATALNLDFAHTESVFTYGLVEEPYLFGYDMDGIRVPDLDIDPQDYIVEFEVTFAALDEISFTRNSSGSVTSALYSHRGAGDLTLGFYRNQGRLAPLIGSFRATVFGLAIDAREGGGPDIHYQLGSGEFDAPLATFLGVGRKSVGGYGAVSMLAKNGTTSYLMPEREGWDGGGQLVIAVPEPSPLALGVLSAATLLFVRRQALP